MKNISVFFILFILVTLFPGNIRSQSPQAFNYQGVARNASGQPVTNQAIGLKISIVQIQIVPVTKYTETHNVMSNDVGVFSCAIGQGTVVYGNFSTLSWSTVEYLLKVEMDVTGGTSYQFMGMSPLLSVPYALYAERGGDDYTAGAGISISGSNVISASDVSPTNEIQTLSVAGSNLTISGGNTVALPTGIPSGSSGNTLRHNGTSWIANSFLYNDGTNLGIGTTSPSAKFTLSNGSLLATGSTGETPVSGNGVRMMWVPAKRALRAGMVTGTNWDNDSLGSYSVAFGYNTKATTSYSAAFGNATKATGANSTAMGYNTLASGGYSFAAGYSTQAKGSYSSVLGYSSTAEGSHAVALGSSNHADGDYSFATGYSSEATNDYAFTTGNNNLASGTSSFATGNLTEASGSNSSVFGYSTTASGNHSSAFGYSTTASGNQSACFGTYSTSQAFSSMVIGKYNVLGGTIDSWVNADPLFVAGNGTSSSNRSNAFTILKDGRTGIGVANPSYMLEVQNASFNRCVYLNNTYDGSSTKYGIYNMVSEEGSLLRYGLYNYVYGNSLSSSPSYGIYNYINPNSSAGSVYGLYTSIVTSGTGTHYGIYSSADGGWAGYFPAGDVYVEDQVGIGTNDIPAGYMLAVDGKVICEEVKVQLSSDWPDYVFDKSYPLLPLNELEKSVKIHHHLPGLPSSAEINENGLSLSDMTVRLTSKVEELTLYLLELNRKMEKLQKENEWLKRQMSGR